MKFTVITKSTYKEGFDQLAQDTTTQRQKILAFTRKKISPTLARYYQLQNHTDQHLELIKVLEVNFHSENQCRQKV